MLTTANCEEGTVLTQQASKCYGRRKGGKVDEDDCSHALAVQRVLEVAEVLRVTALDVSYQASEGAAGALQRVVRLLQRGEQRLCGDRKSGGYYRPTDRK